MPRENTINTSWTKGEVSPLASGRVDVNLYTQGAKTIENLIVRPQGPVFRRSGTKFVRSTKLPTQMARIIPFTVSDETAYELEFGAGYIHFYKNKEPLFETTTTEVESYSIADNGGLAQIEAGAGLDEELPGWGDLSLLPGTPTDNGTVLQTAGAGGTVRMTTSVPHTLRTGVEVKVLSGDNTNGVNNTTPLITRISAYAFDLVGSTYVGDVAAAGTIVLSLGLLPGDRVFFSGGAENTVLAEQYHTVASVDAYNEFTVANVRFSSIVDTTPSAEEVHTIPIEVVTTFTESELNEIQFVQSADVLYILHPDHKPQKLTRLDDDGDRNDWLLADVEFMDGPYLPLNDLSPNVDTTTPANGTRYSDVYFQISSYAHTATVTSATDFDAANDDNGTTYLEYRVDDQWRLALVTTGSIAPGTPRTGTVSIIDNVLLYLDESIRLTNKANTSGSSNNSAVYYKSGRAQRDAQTAALFARNGRGQNGKKIDPNDAIRDAVATTAAGTIQSQFSNTFSLSDVGKYIRYKDVNGAIRWAIILNIPAASTNAGSQASHDASVAMVSNSTTGNFVITNETRTATISAFRGVTAFAAFAASDVGRLVRLGFSGRWTWGVITAVDGGLTSATLSLKSDMPRDPHNAANIAGALDGAAGTSSTTGRTYDWRMGAWSATTGYPAVATFHEERLWFANTVTTPQTLWGSISGDFEILSPTELDSTVLDDSAIAVTLGSTKANAIKWLVSGPAMTIGTSGGEWQMRANSSINEAITPSNVKVVEYTGHGSLGRPIPARVGSSIVFVDSSGEKVQEVFYSYEKDALDSDDLTVISEHILREHDGAVASAFQQKPHSIFWVVCGDGTLAALTINKKQEVIAWHHHTIQGGTVEDISVIPSADAGEDEVWMVVKRTINSATARYIEVLEPDFYPDSSSSRLGMKFLDSHKYIEGYTGTSVTGLNYLEGQSVVVVKDGTRVSGTSTVASGAITLAAGATTELLIGLNSNADLVSLPPEGGSGFGTSQGQRKRLIYMDTRFYNTMNVSFGPSITGTLIPKNLPVVSPAVWFTGTDRLTPAHGYDVESPWAIRQSEPYPLNILFVVSKLETHE